MRIVISILVIIIALPIMFLVDGNADSGTIGPVVKGLYIGMDSGSAQEVAIQIVQKICGSDIEKETTTYDDYTGFMVSCNALGLFLSDRKSILLHFGKHNNVIRIRLSINLLGTSDWTLEEFAQAFMNAYNIPELDVKQEYRSHYLGESPSLTTTYFYNDRKAGYGITISDFIERNVVIKRISKTDELKLD